MNFDFRASYSSKTNKELLLIVADPEKYQPIAIQTANEILADREVSEQERLEVYDLLHPKQQAGSPKPDSEHSIFDHEDFRLVDETWIKHWLIACALILVANPLHSLIDDLSLYISLILDATGLEYIRAYSLVLDVIYAGAVAGSIMLLLRKKPGWHLAAMSATFVFISCLTGLIQYTYHPAPAAIIKNLISGIAFLAILVVLCTPTMRRTFDIHETPAVLSILISAIVSFAICASMTNGFTS